MTAEKDVAEEITRYLSYGWEWELISKLINRKFDTKFTVDELKRWWELWQGR